MSILNSVVLPLGNWPRCPGKQEAGDNPPRAKQAKATIRVLVHRHSTDTIFSVIHVEPGAKQQQLGSTSRRMNVMAGYSARGLLPAAGRSKDC